MIRQSSQALLVALLAPALLGLLVFRLYPIAIAIISSFYTTLHGDNAFTGLGNYASLFGDRVFWKSIGVTLGSTSSSTRYRSPFLWGWRFSTCADSPAPACTGCSF